jgi:hypothetical protein
MFLSGSANAFEVNNPASEYDSIYRYNALENKITFTNLAVAGDINTTIKELPKNNILPVPDDISQKLQDITKKQNFSTIKMNDAIKIIENRSMMTAFLIGNSIGVLKFQLVQIKDLITELNALTTKTEDSVIKNKIDSQIKFLNEEQRKVENYILKQKNSFSVFGWFVTIL